jgi:hypothetical protein
MQIKLLWITNVDFDIIGQSTTDHIFYIRQILEKKWEYNGSTIHQLFMKFRLFRDVAPCSLGADRRFKRVYCLHHQGDRLQESL